jgi:uncharacterized Tic20 family protein
MKTLSPLYKSEDVHPDETSHAVIIHLSSFVSYLGIPFGSILGPLITWLIWREEGSFTNEHGKEALNFNLSIFIYQILAFIVGIFFFITPVLAGLASNNENPLTFLLSIPGLWIFVSGFGLLQLFKIVAIIIAAIKAGNGEYFKYPLSIRFIK